MIRLRPRYELRQDVVPVAAPLLHGLRRRHALSVAVDDQPGEQARRVRGLAERSGLAVAGRLVLDALPEFSLDDRLVLAGVDLALVPDLAVVNRILQQGIECAARKAVASCQRATSALASFADDAEPIEFVVLNCCVTDTKEAPAASSTSTILAKSASDRVNRSTL